MTCSYGCGREAKYKFKNGKWCCCESTNACSGIVKKRTKKRLGRTKKNHEGVRRAAEKLEGRTKETHEGVARTAKKKTGRTKENDEGRRTTSERLTGRNKKNDKIIKRRSEKQSERMKGNKEVKEQLRKARRQIKNPSKDEVKLREIVKELYSASEHTYKVLERRDYEVDNALLEYKIVVEYDGYYHFDTEEHKEYHNRRQKEIEEDGWKFIRYNIFQKVPTKEQVQKDIRSLLEREDL